MGIHIQRDDFVVGKGEPDVAELEYTGQVYIDVNDTLYPQVYYGIYERKYNVKEWMKLEAAGSEDNKVKWGLSIVNTKEDGIDIPVDIDPAANNRITFTYNNNDWVQLQAKENDDGNLVEGCIELHVNVNKFESMLSELMVNKEEIINAVSNMWQESTDADLLAILDDLSKKEYGNIITDPNTGALIIASMNSDEIRHGFNTVFGE